MTFSLRDACDNYDEAFFGNVSGSCFFKMRFYSSYKPCNKMSLPASLKRDKLSIIISEYEVLSSHNIVMLIYAYL